MLWVQMMYGNRRVHKQLLRVNAFSRWVLFAVQNDADVTASLLVLARSVEDPPVLQWLCEQPNAIATIVELVAIAEGRLQQQQAAATESATVHLEVGVHMHTLLQGCRLLFMAAQAHAKAFTQQEVKDAVEVITGEHQTVHASFV